MKVIAEAGTGHSGSIEKAKQLIDTAKDCGADCIKFQWVYADEILHPNTGIVNLPGGAIQLYDKFKELEVTPDFFYTIRDYCKSIDIEFMCSPFGFKSLEELLKINPDYIKIASPELNYIQLLEKLSNCQSIKDGKIPVVISSGVSKISDIEKALKFFNLENTTLLHCITQYPAPVEEYNLELIKSLSSIFGVKTGVSDHSLDPVIIPLLSQHNGAVMLEKHITLSNDDEGLDDAVALNPKNFSIMVKTLRKFEDSLKDEIFTYLEKEKCLQKNTILQILGDGVKKLAKSEAENYGRTNRSLRFIADIHKGQIVSIDDIGILRSEKNMTPGLPPEFLELFIGKKVIKDITSGQEVSWNSFF